MLEKNFSIFSCDRADMILTVKSKNVLILLDCCLEGKNLTVRKATWSTLTFDECGKWFIFILQRRKASYDCLLIFTFLSRLEDLRVKLENEGLVNISYVVVNHQSPHSQKKFHLLQESVSDHIAVYQQDDHQADVWTTLNGNKDDFLIYDRFVFKGKDWKIFSCS